MISSLIDFAIVATASLIAGFTLGALFGRHLAARAVARFQDVENRIAALERASMTGLSAASIGKAADRANPAVNPVLEAKPAQAK